MEHPFFINGGGGNTARAEAIRWLSIAEKLLTNRDLVGSKSFATRARESDPSLLPAEQILAIVDTLIAGDKRINNQHADYYAILQINLNESHDSELIANQYRRLALLLNPQKNTYPYADHAFRLLLDAWSVLSNAFRRSVYDKEIGFFLNLNPVVVTPSPPNNNNNNNNNNNVPLGFIQQQPSTSVVFAPQLQHQRQTVTFLQDPHSQPMSREQHQPQQQQQQQQTVTFLSKNQTQQQQPVVSSSTMLSPQREQQQQQQQQRPFTFGTSSAQRQQQQVVDQRQGNNRQAAPQRNEGFMANNQNHSTSTTSNINVNNEGVFGNNQNRSSSICNNNVNNEGVFGNNQNRSASISNNNVNNEGLFGHSQSHAASTSNKNVNKGKQGVVGVSCASHDVPSFWTACPYCYLMYEYALDYVDCTLRCQKCKRAFQAVKISSPPPIVEGKEAYYCCWGFMPLGFSMEIFKKYKGNISSWTPFAPMKHGVVRKPATPRVYIDDVEDDVFLGSSDSSEESDEDWKGVQNERKKAKSGKRKSRRGRKKKVKIHQSEKGKDAEVNAGDHVQGVSATQGGVEMPNVTTAQSSKRGVAGNTRRQAGRVVKDVGKLDLNVELSNEVEEPSASGVGQGNGAETGEDGNIEGIEFFEGLDEFLSSLPILNAVGDDKVKAS